MHPQHALLLLLAVFCFDLVPSKPIDDKGYHFAYTSNDGARREESGTFKYIGVKSDPILSVKGFYSYFDGAGREFKFHYEADEKGSRTKGDIIPPLPARPPTIQTTSSTEQPPEITIIPIINNTLPPLPPLPPRPTTPPALEISSAVLASLAGK